MQGYHPGTDGSQPVQVASIQTLMRRKLPAADIVLVDEAHRWFDFYGKWMAMPEWQKVPFVGLSATPYAKGLGKHYDDLIIAATTAELIDKGFLSPYRVYAPAHPDLTGVKTVAGDYHEGQLSEVMRQPVLVADTVSTWLRLGEDRPTLCFGVDRAHARRLADEFEAAGVSTGYIDMDTPADERQRIGERLKDGRIKVVCNVYTLTTGVDWDVRCIILARPTKSEILYVQIIGRGLRTAEGKSDCLILDHSDTTLRLGFPSDIHHDTLDDGRHKQSGGARKEEADAAAEGVPQVLLPQAGRHPALHAMRLCARAAIEDRGAQRRACPTQRQAQVEGLGNTALRAGCLFDAALGPAGARLQTGLCGSEIQGSLWPLAKGLDGLGQATGSRCSSTG